MLCYDIHCTMIIHICIYVYIYICMYVYIYIYIHAHISLSLSISLSTNTYVHKNIHISYTHTWCTRVAHRSRASQNTDVCKNTLLLSKPPPCSPAAEYAQPMLCARLPSAQSCSDFSASNFWCRPWNSSGIKSLPHPSPSNACLSMHLVLSPVHLLRTHTHTHTHTCCFAAMHLYVYMFIVPKLDFSFSLRDIDVHASLRD